ncbi:MAG: hypothetical protein COZ91_03245 [Candidatus Nealsonbacteria bacterium CG_4_8_14_3_um_filter_39_7]|uniref:PIN domain-containing protein n=1 Tax=Candidatus Nealsonbacteria bacterium CG23_combo_of_CG06-09_8_20_14_all_39_17 TaxID=1974722 RepID=A0A2G9YUI6_9BACT|nr:MAG: hypothetical protein COX37_01545 [Candidatus Nealsonbacteria bacterium CG23_combo_of_CG06-09_8_20_14_all_39_17]PIU44092.1 MAG: hypothetical protein COS96_00800 [Candidatus Nealsonbacteria bacterium CG07_land_8_20_14_0_80_39_13]PIW90913.1 MAG: hypothetical protein COZ91_03245 [Candidatus Nealsonbacteria bacterium CG_4_8_14_3_um_filter_39_7]
MPKKFKIFLDSSALISGLNSPTGAAGIILSAYISGEFLIYVSDQVLEEVSRNIELKFPLLKESFLNFLLSQPRIIDNPSIKEIGKAHELILTEDAPILVVAMKLNPDFLITWDKKHFLKKEVLLGASFTICTPKDFIQTHWKK